MPPRQPSSDLLFSLTKKDFKVETFRCGGHGGQAVNKLETGVRIRHQASGAVAESREHAEQEANRRNAFRKLAKDPKFKFWLKLEASRLAGRKTPEQVVEEQMAVGNLRIDVHDEKGRWIEWNEEEEPSPGGK